MMPSDPKLFEAVILACLEKNPVSFRKVDEAEVKRAHAAIKRATTPKGAAFRDPVTRKHFLCGCLDFTEHLPEEHLTVGYGYRYGNTTEIERLHHVAGEQRRVSVPDYIRAEIRRHHFHRSDAEVIVFHNHPRTGNEPEWFYTLKSLLQEPYRRLNEAALPSATAADASRAMVRQAVAMWLFCMGHRAPIHSGVARSPCGVSQSGYKYP